jgi:hypothetical protein
MQRQKKLGELLFGGAPEQGCQMIYYRTTNSNLGKFFECFGMGKVGIFFGYSEYIMAI